MLTKLTLCYKFVNPKQQIQLNKLVNQEII